MKKDKEAQKKITNGVLSDMIEKLAVSTAKGFEGVDKKFSDIDKKFSDIDKKFENLETKLVSKLDGVEDRLSSKINGLDRRIDELALNRVKYSDFDPVKKAVQVLKVSVASRGKRSDGSH